MARKSKKKEVFWNVPNVLSMSRIFLTIAIIFMILTESNITAIVVIFVIAAITDFLDGQIARMFNQKTEIVRKLDMIADRFLMIGTVLTFIIMFEFRGLLTGWKIAEIFFIMSRELISFPFTIIIFSSGLRVPKAIFIGKLTTVLQGFAFPIFLLSIYHPFFEFSIYLSAITGVVGAISSIFYIREVFMEANK